MKNICFFAAIVCLILTTISCKSKQVAVASVDTGSSNTNSTAESANPAICRLVVSFISKGEGTDGKKIEALETYSNNHKKKPVYNVQPWGREGERDYSFKLTELSKSEQIDFIVNVKKLMAGSDMANVQENIVPHQPRK